MLAYRLFKYFITTAIILLLAIAISACAVKDFFYQGYKIDLQTHMSEHVLVALKKKFIEMGFAPSGQGVSLTGKPAIVKMFKKEIIIPESGLFRRDRKVALHADVILYKTGEVSDTSWPWSRLAMFYEKNAEDNSKVKPNNETGEPSDASIPIEIMIYEEYAGNNPKVKPYLVEAANSLESALRVLLPETSISRFEHPTMPEVWDIGWYK
jgi:hypothetical protein